jgi:hypothetical protein
VLALERVAWLEEEEQKCPTSAWAKEKGENTRI